MSFKIVFAGGELGPFDEAVEETDRFIAGGAVYFKSMLANATLIEGDFVAQPPLDVLKAAAAARVALRTRAAFEMGFPVPSGAMQGEILQVRNNEDRTN